MRYVRIVAYLLPSQLRALKAAAKRAGVSLSEYLRQHFKRKVK